MTKFLSGRQKNLKIGITSYSENTQVLGVIGRVGIGSTVFDAQYDLDIRGTSRFSGNVTLGANLYPDTDGLYDVGRAPQIGLGANRWRNANFLGKGTFDGGVDAHDLELGVGSANLIYSTSGNLELNSQSGTTNIDDILTVSGNTGIGTVTPKAKLDVFGNVNISGIITTTSINFYSGGLLGDPYSDGGFGLKSGANQYAIITSNNLQQYLQVDDNYVFIGTGYGSTTGSYEWTFRKDGSTQFPNSLILAPVSQSITLQSDQYSQLMWSHVTDQSTADIYGNTNTDFYVSSGNATLDIGYKDGSNNQQYKSWLWNKSGTFTVPGAIIGQGELKLAGGQNSYDIGRYIRLRDGDVSTHIHIDSPDNSTYDLILGDDTKHIRVDHDGSLVIRTGISPQIEWEFNPDSSAIFPGNTGIGTTNPTSKLWVDGDVKVSGVVTATTFIGNLTGTATTATNLADAANITTGFINKDRLLNSNSFSVLGDLYVSNNISFGGTATQLNLQQLQIVDADIVLGIGTSFSPTDNTANHGGIAIASTEGSPLVDLNIVPEETNPSTYKKIMWFKGSSIGAGITDAWLFNYAVGVGSTRVPNGVRLAAGGMQVTDTTISTPNLNVSGVGTFQSSGLKIRNPANTFGYTITGGAIAADRILNLPVITTTDTVAVLGLSQTFSGNITVSSGNITHTGTTQNFTATSYTTGTVTIGGPSQTGTITVGQATTSQTLNLATGTSGVGTTKTINFGTGGASGSFTQINIGPTAGVGTVTINSGTNLGIGTTTPTSALTVIGNVLVSGISTLGITTATNLTAQQLNVSGITTVGFLTATNISVSGIVTSNAYYIGTTQVISSARQLQNIASLDATTTATIETAIQQAPNDFTSLNISGISTLQSTTLIGGGTSTGTANQVFQVTGISSGAYIGGNLGIGNTNPQDALDVGIGTIRLINKSSTGRYSQIYQNNELVFSNSSTNDDFSWTNSSGSRMRLYGTGNLVIPGTFTPTGTASQKLQVDGGAYVSGSVGIGTTNPTSALTVQGNVLVSGVSTFIGDGTAAIFAQRNINNVQGIKLYGTSSGNFVYSESTPSNSKSLIVDSNQQENILFRIAGATKAVIQPSGELLVGTATSTGTASQILQVTGGAYVSGNLGIGTTNPTSKLHVQGNALISGIITATDYDSASDMNLKKNIKPFENALDKVIQINGVTFEWKKTNSQSAGIIAQDVEKVFPELVRDGDFKTVNYNGLIGVLVESIKELKQEIENLKSKLNDT